jgi:hypothetical protein
MGREKGLCRGPCSANRCARLCAALFQGAIVVVDEWLVDVEAPLGAWAFCSLWLCDCEPSALVVLELELELVPLASLEKFRFFWLTVPLLSIVFEDVLES